MHLLISLLVLAALFTLGYGAFLVLFITGFKTSADFLVFGGFLLLIAQGLTGSLNAVRARKLQKNLEQNLEQVKANIEKSFINKDDLN